MTQGGGEEGQHQCVPGAEVAASRDALDGRGQDEGV